MLLRKPVADYADRELVDLYKESGDLEVLGLLYQRYMTLVYGVALKYLKNRDEAKDQVMEIFEKLTGTLLNHQVTHFKSWLYVLTRNHCLMMLRAQKTRLTEEISPLLMENEGDAHPESEWATEHDLLKLEKCIEQLVTEQKQCVKLFYLHQRCYAEICDETGFAMNQVKSYLQNGKRNLKICMDKRD
jgi:RNA polymerase sigma-70 factor (ECF subfamily)